ncbi:uncharacterized protein B0H18DRAFT_828475, partial [Fomitopsis serialis]|uniref:uncharacterized protein n=1 Tax=Fomitopsis serialis TaxID=139415 RepID=UPI0020084CDD
MGKLNIAHHKSYHPYRRDNIERVRQDEEEARLKEAVQEGRMMLADSEARIDLLRQRAGLASQRITQQREEGDEEGHEAERNEAGPSSIMSGGHINLFEDVERQMVPVHGRSTKKAAPETEKGIPLAPLEKDLKPWYSDHNSGKGKDRDEARESRELARKSVNDPLTSINHQLSARPGTQSTRSTFRSRPSRPDRPPPSSSEPRSAEAARMNRESAERQRALELIRRKKRETAGSETPSTVHGGVEEGYRDVFNRREVDEARKHRERRWDEKDRR